MSILVVGAGIMGRGIAYVAAEAGFSVVLVDADADALKSTAAYFKAESEQSDLDPQDILGRITTKSSIEEGFKHAPIEFAIEAVPEKLEIKEKVFAAFAENAEPTTILATNTSSIPITTIAEAIEPKERVIGLHFFNPVPMMPGLEIIPTKYTSQSTIDRTVEFGERLSKKAVVCNKDIAGFIVNRVLTAMMLEATNILERDVVSFQDVDKIMKSAAGMPMGPFRLADVVGLDTINSLMQVIYAHSGNDPKYKPSKTIERLVSEGKLGVKTGEGFYIYKKGKL